MSKRAWIFIVLLILLIFIGGGYILDRYRSARYSTLSGFFESQPTEVSSRVQGRVRVLLVREGDTVRKGQLLAILEASPTYFDLEASLASAEAAKQRKQELINGTRWEEIEKQVAVVAEFKADWLKAVHGPLPEEIEAGRQKVIQARARLQVAEQGSRPQEIEVARAAERQARAQLDIAIRGLTYEERLELKARLNAARSKEVLSRADYERALKLFSSGAVSQSNLDSARSAYETAIASRQDAEQTYLRAQRGTPPEELRSAEEAYRQAKAHLDLTLAGSRPEDIESARNDLRIAEMNYRLLETGSRQEDIDAAKARLDQAVATLTEMRNGNRVEEIAQAVASEKASHYQAKSIESQYQEYQVIAPIDGFVQKVPIAEGDLLTAGTSIMELDNPDDIWVRVYMPETELAKIKVRSSAVLYIDGIKHPLDAYVQSIDTVGEFTPENLQSPENRGKQVFGLRIRLKKPDRRVKPGMYATIKRVGNWNG